MDEGYSVRVLSPETWDAFAALVERHNGVWSGCWCTWFIAPKAERHGSGLSNQEIKKQCVDEGRNHAALLRHARGAAEHLPPQAVRRRGHAAPRLPAHLLL